MTPQGYRHNAAVELLAKMMFGISETTHSLDPETPDLAADFESAGEHAVCTTLTLPSGDTYRVTIEWLGDKSP